MKIQCSLFLILTILLGVTLASAQQKKQKESPTMKPKSVLDFTMSTIDGKPQPLSAYKGKVLMIVNTASECGYTPQYETLQKLYETYKEKGLRLLAFPANNFGEQELGSNSEIKTFCSTKYHTTFDLFEKISVKGKDQHPLYKYITQDSPFPGDVKWNFQKYLVDRSGKVVAKYLSAIDPMSKEVRSEVEKLLK
ncbi:MAG: glutathione peroxidase [Ignavibacteriae bacterium]|nr:glutathione peroxidase [Ignavibacteria bacterium]MBI3363658.1 glutathione peroxidase [Ignavibacteriota bacterium]